MNLLFDMKGKTEIIRVVISSVLSFGCLCTASDPSRFKLEPYNPALGSFSCEHGLVDRVDHFLLSGTINYKGVPNPHESRVRLVLMGGGSYMEITSISNVRAAGCNFTLQIPIDKCLCVSDTGQVWAFICNITARLENSEKIFKMLWLPRTAMHVSQSRSLPVVFDICDMDADPIYSTMKLFTPPNVMESDCDLCRKKEESCSMPCPNCANGCCHSDRTCAYCKLGFKHPQKACATACEPYEYGLDCLGTHSSECGPGSPVGCARAHGARVYVDLRLLLLMTYLIASPTGFPRP